jgi:hypothetical protein
MEDEKKKRKLFDMIGGYPLTSVKQANDKSMIHKQIDTRIASIIQ